MIQKYVDRFYDQKFELRAKFAARHVSSYRELVRMVVETVTSDEYGDMDPSRIHEIDDGDYQGTLLFVIAANGYQPRDYWAVKVYYGSCSGCDTLQAISNYSSDPPTEDEVNDYMALALHVVQGLTEV